MLKLLQSNSPRRAKRDHVLELVAKASGQPTDLETKEIVGYLFDRHEYLDAARWLCSHTTLEFYDPHQLLKLRNSFPRPYLSIGGGPTFAYPFWENLDAVVGPLNPKPFHLGADVILPFKTHSFELVYISQALHHLDDATVAMTLSEAHRILRPGAPILLKSSDSDVTLEATRIAENHRNGWSLEEMSALLASHEFEMISTDKRKIVPRYNFVPRLGEKYEISTFFLAAAK